MASEAMVEVSYPQVSNSQRLCLQGGINGNHVSTTRCDNSEQQKCVFDIGGLLRNTPHANLCLVRTGKKLHFAECAKLDKRSSVFVDSNDDTLRINGYDFLQCTSSPNF